MNEELIKAMHIAATNLIGQFPDNLKPMSAQLTRDIGEFLLRVADGETVEQALSKRSENVG